MTVARALVLLAGFAGLAAVFLPVLELERDGVRARVTPFQVIRGVASVERAGGDEATWQLDSDAARLRHDVHLEDERDLMVACLAPAVLLIAVGAVAWARRLGRGLSALALCVGMWTSGVWRMWSDQLSAVDVPVERGPALACLLGSAVCGCVGGIMGLVRPEPPRVAAKPPVA
jgi:hypothetical protein